MACFMVVALPALSLQAAPERPVLYVSETYYEPSLSQRGVGLRASLCTSTGDVSAV